MTKAELLDAIRQCLYGECKDCILFEKARASGSNIRCRMELLYQAEQILSGEGENK